MPKPALGLSRMQYGIPTDNLHKEILMKKFLLPMLLTAMFFTGMTAPVQAQQASQNDAVVASQAIKVNINTASVSELTTLPGIGQAKASAIVEYRNQHGNFESIEALTKVKGIGEKLMLRLAQNIVVE